MNRTQYCLKKQINKSKHLFHLILQMANKHDISQNAEVFCISHELLTLIRKRFCNIYIGLLLTLLDYYKSTAHKNYPVFRLLLIFFMHHLRSKMMPNPPFLLELFLLQIYDVLCFDSKCDQDVATGIDSEIKGRGK